MTDKDTNDIVRLPDEITPEQQVQDWIAGNGYHNDHRYVRLSDNNGQVVKIIPMVGGECCPDFSCCYPKLAWPLEERHRFLQADKKTKQGMLGMAMTALLKEVEFAEPVILETSWNAQELTGSKTKH